MSKNENYTIPVWFFKAVGFASFLVVPWVCWVSLNISEMCANQKIIMKNLETLETLLGAE